MQQQQRRRLKRRTTTKIITRQRRLVLILFAIDLLINTATIFTSSASSLPTSVDTLLSIEENRTPPIIIINQYKNDKEHNTTRRHRYNDDNDEEETSISHINKKSSSSPASSSNRDDGTIFIPTKRRRKLPIDDDENNPTISYVIEPFEHPLLHNFTHIDDETKSSSSSSLDLQLTPSSSPSLTSTTTTTIPPPLFGQRALLINYTLSSSPTTTTSTKQHAASFGTIVPPPTAYNCRGATHLSLWYNIIQPSTIPQSVSFRGILMDDSDCTTNDDVDNNNNVPSSSSFCEDMANLEHYETVIHRDILDGSSIDDGWNELRMDLPQRDDDDSSSSVWKRIDNMGIVGNDVLDIDRIRGWRIELTFDGTTTMGESSSSGSLLIDHLSCVGPGDELFNAAFLSSSTSSSSSSLPRQSWHERYYESPLSRNGTHTTLSSSSSTLSSRYTIEQVASWGGFLDYSHVAPSAAYYNLSSHDTLSMEYDVMQPASIAGRAHLRIILLDGSDCIGSARCGMSPGQYLENYYSFHYILDEEMSSSSGEGVMRVPLVGDGKNSSRPFWRTGWTGIVGNDVLDKEYIKGYRLELNIDSQGSIGSSVSGALSLRHLRATTTTSEEDEPKDQTATCRMEPGVSFPENAPVFKKIEFAGRQCCNLCLDDPTCIYAQSNGKDCFVASSLPSSETSTTIVALINNEYTQSKYTVYWMDDGRKRKSFCEMCRCDYANESIDCRGVDLAVIPKYLIDDDDDENETLFMPRMLDLRNNPRLTFIGSGMFDSLKDSLEELHLPHHLIYLSQASLTPLTKLHTVNFEVLENSPVPLRNVITSPQQIYSDTCCAPTPTSTSSLSFCSMTIDHPGVDAIYHPFTQYVNAAAVQTIHPSSSFMSEAASSPEKCAAYCEIVDSCRYFSHDARWKESEPTCYLLENEGLGGERVCCGKDDYGDESGRSPGWVSGYPPRTRVGAVVRLDPTELNLEESNGYESFFDVTLGEMPLRGSVVVEPKQPPPASSNNDGWDVVIEPKRVVLYDNVTTARIRITATIRGASPTANSGDGKNAPPPPIIMGSNLIIMNDIISCDAAFSSAPSNNTLYLTINPPVPPSQPLTLSILLPLSLCCLLLLILLYYVRSARSKRKDDAVWEVKPEELHFDDPPVIVGRGTFGLVLLAEYRGTQVAVKRVIPPRVAREETKKMSGIGSSGGGSRRSFFRMRTSFFGRGAASGFRLSDAMPSFRRSRLASIIGKDNETERHDDISDVEMGGVVGGSSSDDEATPPSIETFKNTNDDSSHLDSSQPTDGDDHTINTVTIADDVSSITPSHNNGFGDHGGGTRLRRRSLLNKLGSIIERRKSNESQTVAVSNNNTATTRKKSLDMVFTPPLPPPPPPSDPSLLGLVPSGGGSGETILDNNDKEHGLKTVSFHPRQLLFRSSSSGQSVENGAMTTKVTNSKSGRKTSSFGMWSGSRSRSSTSSDGQQTTTGFLRSVKGGKIFGTTLGRKQDTYAKLKADFIEEMRHLSKLRHPCIVTVLGAVISKHEEPMLVMEYMDHGSLYDLLHNNTMLLSGELLLPILRDIAQGIRFLHAAGPPQVIHGDLKAQNVLVDSRFRAKVADFGLSQKKKRMGGGGGGSGSTTGTPFWMAPELLRGESTNTTATDVYAFGIVLYEVYSRKDPYEGEDDYREVLRQVADRRIEKRPPVPDQCPPQVHSLMSDCLLGDPVKRPSFEELDKRLKRLSVDTVEPGVLIHSRQAKKRNSLTAGSSGLSPSQTQRLLFEVFPPHIAQALLENRKVEPESRDVVTIFFSDIVGFTTISSKLSPIKISEMLDRLYNKFDTLSRKHDVFKVETIGDAYMAVTNLVKDQRMDHAARIANFSIEVLRAANETLIDEEDESLGCVNIRVGFHSGPVVANVVGSRNPRYCLFGDTVNTASRMESNSEKNRIHCSNRAVEFLKVQDPFMKIRSRGVINVKGKGEMNTFWVNEEEEEREEGEVVVGDDENGGEKRGVVLEVKSSNIENDHRREYMTRQETKSTDVMTTFSSTDTTTTFTAGDGYEATR